MSDFTIRFFADAEKGCYNFDMKKYNIKFTKEEKEKLFEEGERIALAKGYSGESAKLFAREYVKGYEIGFRIGFRKGYTEECQRRKKELSARNLSMAVSLVKEKKFSIAEAAKAFRVSKNDIKNQLKSSD